MFLRSSIGRLSLRFDSSDALGHGGGGSGDGVGLVEVFQHLKTASKVKGEHRGACCYLDGDIEGLAGELLRHLVGEVQGLNKEVGRLNVSVSY